MPVKILTSKECKALLAEFRESWRDYSRKWMQIGELALSIRDQEAYADLGYDTFVAWIAGEHFERAVIYDAIHAVTTWRLIAPAAERLKLVMDRESHFRPFPADCERRKALAIAEGLGKSIEPAADGNRYVTARLVQAAVDAVFPPEAKPETKAPFRETEAADFETKGRQTEPPAASIEPTWAVVQGFDEPDTLPDLVDPDRPQAAAARQNPPQGTCCEVEWAVDLQDFRRDVAAKFLPLFQKHGHDQEFLSAAATVFRNWSEEVAHRQPTRRAK